MKTLIFSAAAFVAFTLVAGTAEAQGPGGMLGRMQSRAMIMMRGGESLQKELKITEDQMAKFNELAEEMRSMFGGGGGGPDLDALADVEKEMMKILDDSQKKRLTGIYVQVAGFMSLKDEEVVKAIGLSDAEQETIGAKIDEVSQEMQREMQDLIQSGDRQAMRQAITEMREKANKEVFALLTAEQAKKLEELKGEKFEMPLGFGRGGRGGGGGEGGPGRGGRGGGGGGGNRTDF